MKFKIFRTKTFEKEFEKLPKIEQEMIVKFENKLVEDPFLGKPLGYLFFREKKLNRRRIYYLVYEDLVVVLMVGVSDKKTQQATIDNIRLHLNLYYEVVKEALK